MTLFKWRAYQRALQQVMQVPPARRNPQKAYREFYESYAYLKDRTVDPEFLKWFIGFTEGDGHFGISGNRLLFFLVQKDREVLEFIQKNLGFGRVQRHNIIYHRYAVTDTRGLYLLANLFNGNLLSFKGQWDFYDWVTHYNNIYGSGFKDNIDLQFSPRFPSSHLNWWHNMKASRPRRFFVGKQRPDLTADGPSTFPFPFKLSTHQEDFGPWLSGFIDSEGGFEKTGHLRFTIDQKWDQPLLETISDFLGCGRVSRRKEREHMYRLVVTSGRQNVIEHCDKFPLRSIKSNDFIKWKETLARLPSNPTSRRQVRSKPPINITNTSSPS